MGVHDAAVQQDQSIPVGRIFQQPISAVQPVPPVVMDVDDSVQDALNFMQLKQMGCVLITRGMTLAGILTERDIIAKVLVENADLHGTRVEDIMTPGPEAFRASDTLGVVAKAMNSGGYRHVPIVDEENQPVGIVSIKDILRYIIEHLLV